MEVAELSIKGVIKMKKKKIIATTIGIFFLVLPFIVYPFFHKAIEGQKKKIYEEGVREGWKRHNDYDFCLVMGKAAIRAPEPYNFATCVTVEEAEEMNTSYTSTFEDWCEIYGDCDEKGYGYYDR